MISKNDFWQKVLNDPSRANSNNTHLMCSKRFVPLFFTQFFAALNDNFLKTTLSLLVLAMVSAQLGSTLIALSGAIFIAPFLFLSALGGQLADKYDKARIAQLLKLAEIIVAVFVIFGIYFSSITLLFVALFLFGVGSALFGPIKYALLPDQLPQNALPKANAWIEAATFIAIILGTILASYMINDASFKPTLWAAFFILIFAISSFIFSLKIPKRESAYSVDIIVDKNIFRSTVGLIKELYQEKRLFIVTLMISWFWLSSAILFSLIPPLAKQLGNFGQAIPYFLIIFAVMVAIGSAIAAWASAGRIVLLQAVFGTFIAAIFSIDFGITLASLPTIARIDTFADFFAIQGIIHLSFDLGMIALFSAFLVVPGFAALQAWADVDKRARTIAANNIMNALFMFLGGVIVAFLQNGGVKTASLFSGVPLYGIAVTVGILSIIAAYFMLKFLPTNPFSDFISILFRAFYRLEVKGLEHFKTAGDAPILALNHVSFLDGLLALAICENTTMKPAFAINRDIARKWWIRPFIRYMNAYPIDPTHPLSTRKLIRIVQKGAPLVIFPEGRITVTGGLMKVYDGAAMIADQTRSLIVPIKIDGPEQTIFSRLNEVQVKKRLFPKITVTITKPISLTLDPELSSKERRHKASNELYEIMSDLVFSTSIKADTLFNALKLAAKHHGKKQLAIEDPLNGSFSYQKLLMAARILAKPLAKNLKDEQVCGLMLANSCPTIISFFALQSINVTPAMINFSAGISTILSATKAANIKTIITARKFIKQGNLEPIIEALEQAGIRFIYLEDLKKKVNKKEMLLAFFNKMKPYKKQIATQQPAVILFTSGSEGTPKGVVLTHDNILSNCAQAAARVDFNASDKVFNLLPMFHSFGLTAGSILPLIYGVPVYFYPSPLHYRIIPEAIYSANATIVFATDTFLNGYARMAHPYDLRSIRYCFAGAEPVKKSTRELMMEKFGIRILEGYGVTEAAPVLALNTPLYNKLGTVGKLFPQITAKLEPVEGIEKGGRLYVKGPNIMAGYLTAEQPGILQPPIDGWHDTGDIVDIDTNGFITILGRAKRFAKIGGEMVSLTAVENLANRLWPEYLIAALSIKDEKKGEKIILICEETTVNRAELIKFARSEGIPELFVPSQFINKKIPLLGTGKINYPQLTRDIAENI